MRPAKTNALGVHEQSASPAGDRWYEYSGGFRRDRTQGPNLKGSAAGSAASAFGFSGTMRACLRSVEQVVEQLPQRIGEGML